jgi:glycosyltransferase involved in cell wall biosynthesis
LEKESLDVSVIIATMNEEKGISKVIEGIRKSHELVAFPNGYEILVIDKSVDRTAEIARSLGARVIIQKGRGKGKAMLIGARKALGSILVFIDGDNTYPANQIPKMVSIIQRGEADVVNAVRNFGKMKRTHVIGNTAFSLLASVLYGRTHDLLTGMRAIKRFDFLGLGLKSIGFEIETEMFIRSCKNGLKSVEIPIDYHERLGQTKLNGIEDGWRIFKMLITNTV